jgi:hypothetical protein
VQVLSRIGVPVFLQPSRRQERVEVEGLRLDAGAARFALANRGNVHVRPSAVRLLLLDAGGQPVETRSLEAWYVLAGGERVYSVPLPAETCRRVRSLAVEVDLAPAPLRAAAAAVPAACGP